MQVQPYLFFDGRCDEAIEFYRRVLGAEGFALSVTADDEAQVERIYAGLADGGQVQMPLAKTFFSPRFGMVADRFGVSWMVYVAPWGSAPRPPVASSSRSPGLWILPVGVRGSSSALRKTSRVGTL